MIKELINKYEDNKNLLRDKFSKKHPENYKDILKSLVEVITNDDYSPYALDPDRITEIDHGDYQGTLLYTIAEKGYQPSTFYATTVGYGSCSVCDTLQDLKYDQGNGDSDKPNEKQIEGYMILALHMLQKMKRLSKY